MNILIVGANGFIGSHITATLIKQGYNITCAVRDIETTKLKFPSTTVIKCDLNKDITSDVWMPRLHNIDIVINAAGILNSDISNKIANVHDKGPKALFKACMIAKVKKIIHISALGINDELITEYSSTKIAADDYLKNLNDTNWVILQPSLVYSSGSYGGTSLLRGLATIPFFIPLIGNGQQQFQPVHMSDVVEVVKFCIEYNGPLQKTFKITGPDILTVKEILLKFRAWLGLKPVPTIQIHERIIKVLVKIGDLIGSGPLNSTSYKMMQHPNIADHNEWSMFTGIKPRRFVIALETEPLTLQLLWHARLYLLKPMLKWVLAIFWIATGSITAFLAQDLGVAILLSLGFSGSYANILLYGTCFIDILLGLMMIQKRYFKLACILQIMMVTGYTVTLTCLNPALWLEPFGVLTKNIPIICLTLMLLAINEDR